ncbi:hypothetical protein [Janibacter sp. G368]|uniref:hypothetical protein n=1 Tax=Janibacter sp. G368 TaxID=3420441 RepID=UPI003CFE0F3C
MKRKQGASAHQGADALDAHDVSIWRTVEVMQKQDRGLSRDIAEVSTVFAPQLGRGERMLGSAQFRLLSFTSAGDGSYMHQSGGGFLAVGSGPLIAASLAASGLLALGRAAGNASRRNAAAQAAAHQWRQIDAGVVVVSDHGFYMQTPTALNPWGYGAISGAEVIAPGCVAFTGSSQSGPVHWVLISNLSEMLFTQWARQVHPTHPQYIGHGWIPHGWVQRVQASPYDLPSFGTPQIEGQS